MTAAVTWRVLQPDGTVNPVPGESVGTFSVEFEIANGDDLALARRGILPPQDVRRATLSGLVDTGAARLAYRSPSMRLETYSLVVPALTTHWHQ